MSKLYWASDYAGLKSGDRVFYYGYEKTTDTGEWCFVATISGVEVLRVPVSKLPVDPRDRHDCGMCLLAGIGMYLEEL